MAQFDTDGTPLFYTPHPFSVGRRVDNTDSYSQSFVGDGELSFGEFIRMVIHKPRHNAHAHTHPPTYYNHHYLDFDRIIMVVLAN